MPQECAEKLGSLTEDELAEIAGETVRSCAAPTPPRLHHPAARRNPVLCLPLMQHFHLLYPPTTSPDQSPEEETRRRLPEPISWFISKAMRDPILRALKRKISSEVAEEDEQLRKELGERVAAAQAEAEAADALAELQLAAKRPQAGGKAPGGSPSVRVAAACCPAGGTAYKYCIGRNAAFCGEVGRSVTE